MYCILYQKNVRFEKSLFYAITSLQKLNLDYPACSVRKTCSFLLFHQTLIMLWLIFPIFFSKMKEPLAIVFPNLYS